MSTDLNIQSVSYKLEALRKELHKHPELSGLEQETAKRILAFVKVYDPTEILENVGGNGLAIVYKFSEEGPTICIRCELDALPIEEENQFAHRSKMKSVSHKCGHDGHMAIVAGLAPWLKEQSFLEGQVILLFQPAEETGNGAEKVMSDTRFQELGIDQIFALHNIPGKPMHSILSMSKGFSAEVISCTIRLHGLESHAAEPENGRNPSIAMATLIDGFNNLNIVDPDNSDFRILTLVHMTLGQKSYGISPANGELHYTIRAWTSENMDILKEQMKDMIDEICEKEKINYELDWFEYFPASDNDEDCNNLIRTSAQANGSTVIEQAHPFKFGEDFGWYAKQYKTAMFGLGAGLNTPSLHNADYDFPDEIIETGLNLFKSIIKNVLDQHGIS